MKDFLKKNRVLMIILVIMTLLILNVYLYKDSKNLTQIKSDLELKNYKLNLDVKKSQVKEQKLLREIEEKGTAINRLNKELNDAVEEYRHLKGKISSSGSRIQTDSLLRNMPTDLKACQEKCAQLSQQLNLCRDVEHGAEKSLNLCLDKTYRQKEIIAMQEMVYLECQEQGRLKELKINQTEAAMERLDRFYKRKLLKRDTVKYTIGIIAGILAGYFLFKKKR